MNDISIPVQILQDSLGRKLLFFISDQSGDLLCSEIKYEASSNTKPWHGSLGLIKIHGGPIKGFNVLEENTGRLCCYIYNQNGKFTLVHSQDSGMSWQELGEFS